MKRARTRFLKRAKNRPSNSLSLQNSYESLEDRKLLAAYFPTYINGEFTLGNGDASEFPYDPADTFELSSNPDASKILYLDFTGHHSVDNAWGHNIVFPAFDRDGSPESFSDDELLEIQLQFQNVAEDFLPFDINVTTVEPDIERLRKTSPDDQEYGIRSVNTQATDGFGGFGGIAFLNSFDDEIDNPVFALNKGENTGAMTNSHEVGHSLGLSHDGLGSQQYHPGANGTGITSWGPIMGAPFGTNVTQWSIGDYPNSTNTQDDYQIITKSANGFDFREDAAGDSIAEAGDLEMEAESTTSVFHVGIIERQNDVDFLKFTTGEGDVALTVKSFQGRANLDIMASLYNAEGELIAESNPTNGLDAAFEETLTAGDYYLAVDGVGLEGVYSDYGSIGLFIVEGVVVEPVTGLPIGEVGSVSAVNHNWQSVEFTQEYAEVPVVMAGPLSRVGGDPSTVRIRNVTNLGFEIRLQEWDYLDGRHARETVDYLVIEAGEHILDDGTIVIAGNEGEQNHRWKSYPLGDTFNAVGETPAVFSQVISENDGSAVAARVRGVTTTEFQIRLQEEQGSDYVHDYEQVSWLAIQRNVGQIGELDFESGFTPFRIGHRGLSFNFVSSFSEAPAIFAASQSFDGGDTITVRHTGVNQTSATLFLEEERSGDQEVRHNPERVAYLAIEKGEIYGTPTEAPVSFRSFTPFDDSRGIAARKIMDARNPEVYKFLEHDHDHGYEFGGHHDDHHEHDHHEHEFETGLVFGNFKRGLAQDSLNESPAVSLLDAATLSELSGSVIQDSAIEFEADLWTGVATSDADSEIQDVLFKS